MYATIAHGDARPCDGRTRRDTSRCSARATTRRRPRIPRGRCRRDVTSPTRRINAAAVSPPTIEPTPCIALVTPRNDGGFPIESMQREDERLRESDHEHRDGGADQHRSRAPATRECAARRPRPRRRTYGRAAPASPRGRAASRAPSAETMNVAASSTATAPPPTTAKRPAPASGATSRSPCVIVCSRPFASGSCSSGNTRRSSASASRVEHRAADGVEQRDDVDQPQVAAVVHEEQQEHRHCEEDVRDDHQRPSTHTVGEHARERGGQAPRREHEEDEPRGRVRSRERLRPDPEDDDQSPVAEQRDSLAAEEQARVAGAEQ